MTCYLCVKVQTVPGTSEVFVCGSCDRINECFPTHGILRCYSCNAKVLYPTGTSDFIKCTRCTTVNEIPKKIK